MRRDPDSGLFLPADFVRARDEAKRLGVGVYVTWDDVRNDPFDPVRVPAMLADLAYSELLSVLGAISILLSNRRDKSDEERRKTQGGVALAACYPDAGNRIVELLARQERDVFVFQEQLLMATSLALLYANGDPAKQWEKGAVGDLLLAASQLLSLGDEVLSGRPDFGVAVALRKVGAFETEQARYLLPRYFDLLVGRMAPSADTQGLTDLDHAFAEATGLRLLEYLAFAILYCAPFAQPPGPDRITPPGYPETTAQLEQHIVDQDVLANARESFVTLRADITTELQPPTSGQLMDYMPMRQRPIIRVESGRLLPLSMQFALNKIGTGIYWTLFDHYLHQNRLGEFTDRLGKPFERYVYEVLDKANSTRPPGTWTRFSEDDIRVVEGATDVPARRADCLLLQDDSLVVMEISTLLLKVSTVEQADTVAFEEEVRDRFSHEFGQVFDVIEGLRSGKLEVPGLDRSRVRHIFPVLVLLRPFPQLPSVWDKLRTLMVVDWPTWPESPYDSTWDNFGGALAATQIHYPQILSAEELEMLEPLIREGRTTLPGVLRAKLAHSFGAFSSMETYLLRFSGMPELPNVRLVRRFEEIVEEVREIAHYHSGA